MIWLSSDSSLGGCNWRAPYDSFVIRTQSVVGRHVVDDLNVTIREIRSAIYALQAPSVEDPASLRTQLLTVTDAVVATLGFTPSL